jgi:hypothetical protein
MAARSSFVKCAPMVRRESAVVMDIFPSRVSIARPRWIVLDVVSLQPIDIPRTVNIAKILRRTHILISQKMWGV